MKRVFPVAVFLAVAMASLVTAWLAWFAAQEASRIKFESVADDALNRIASRLEVHISLLRSTQALFEVQDGAVSRAAFGAYFKALDIERNYAGLRGIGFLRLVRDRDDVMSVEREIARQHGVETRIYPETSESLRTPIVLYEPLDAQTASAIGFDMYSDPARRAAIEATLSTDEPQSTGLIALGQNSGGETFPGFLVFQRLDLVAPAPGGGAPESSARGVLYVAYRSGDLFNAALARTPILPVNLEIRDAAPNAGDLVFRSTAPPAPGFGAEFTVSRELKVANATWTALFRPTSAFEDPTSPIVPVFIAVVGLLLAAAMAMVARYQSRAYEAVSALQQTAEKSLAEKDLMLQEMKHRIKNSISRVLAIARQTASKAPSVEEFSTSFSARLQAMAASQDILTRSRWQKADIGELLRTELQQVFGDEVPAEMLSGPRVLLDEAATQALGLTFHELATNAMKYGDIAGLRIVWKVSRSENPRRLELTWTERAQGVEPPQRTGFGTRLIDMNITRELNGTIVRDFGRDGLRIEITIPLGR